MKDYILDANALLRYVLNTEGADKVRAILQQCERGTARASMSVINVGEVYYVLTRRLGERSAGEVVNKMAHVVSYIPAELEEAIAAAKIKHQFKMGYADCFAAALALRLKGTLVSADLVFEKLGKAIKLVKLPRHSSGDPAH